MRKSTGLTVNEILQTLADMGALYPDVTELLRQADTTQALSCRVRNDALPQAVSVYDLVKAGKMKKGKNEEIGLAMDARPDPSATPNLYAPVKPLSFSNTEDQEALLNKKPATKEKATAERSKNGQDK
jgi:hypothetical protein